MDKILIRLVIPVIAREFDVYIPVSVSIQELTDLLIRAVESNTDGAYRSSGTEILCLKEKKELLNQKLTVREYEIQNGDHLVMI